MSYSLFTPPTRTRPWTKLSSLVLSMSAVWMWTQLQTRCLVSTQFPISKFSVILNIFETEQLQIGNWVETRQNCLVLSSILFTPPTRTRQDKTVLSCPNNRMTASRLVWQICRVSRLVYDISCTVSVTHSPPHWRPVYRLCSYCITSKSLGSDERFIQLWNL